MRKVIAAGLSVGIALTMCGCSSGGKDSNSGKTSGGTQSGNDPVKVVVFNNSGGGTGPGSEAGSKKEAYKAVQDYILEKTGVLVEVVKPPSTEYENKLAAMLSSGEQLDLWWGNWSDYAPDKIIQPINKVLESQGKDVYEVFQKWEEWPRCTDKDGNIWGVPRYVQFVSYYSHVRADWLKKLNMQMPSTFDEFEKYLYAVKELDPYGKNETIPFVFKGGSVGASLDWALVGGFTDHGRSNWLDEKGNVMPRELQPGYKDFIAKLAQWYKDGIINKENFSWDTATLRQYIQSGRVAAACTYYVDISQSNGIMQESFPDADFVHNEAGMKGPNGKLCQTLNPGNSKQMLFSAKCDQTRLEALMKVVNWSFANWENYKICNSGIEGVHWDYDTSTVDLATAKKEHVVKKIDNSGYYADFCLSIGLPYESQDMVYDANGKQNRHSLYLSKYLDDYDTCIPTLDGKITYDTKALSENIPTLNDINTTINEELINFVTGARSMDTWDDFIKQLYDNGLDSWIKEYTRQYKELTGK